MSRKMTTMILAIVASIVVVVALTPRIVGGVTLTIVVIGIGTIWVWRRAGGRPATRRMVIPLYGGLLSFMALCTGVVMWTTATSDYHLCLDRVDRSMSSFKSTKRLYDTIDAATGTKHFTSDVLIPGQPSLRGSLQEPVTKHDCAKYAP